MNKKAASLLLLFSLALSAAELESPLWRRVFPEAGKFSYVTDVLFSQGEIVVAGGDGGVIAASVAEGRPQSFGECRRDSTPDLLGCEGGSNCTEEDLKKSFLPLKKDAAFGNVFPDIPERANREKREENH